MPAFLHAGFHGLRLCNFTVRRLTSSYSFAAINTALNIAWNITIPHLIGEFSKRFCWSHGTRCERKVRQGGPNLFARIVVVW